MPPPPSDELTLRKMATLSLQIGSSTALSAVAFILGGLWIDRRFDTVPLFASIGAALGLIVALLLVWRIVRASYPKQ